jgi:hypothetical protein
MSKSIIVSPYHCQAYSTEAIINNAILLFISLCTVRMLTPKAFATVRTPLPLRRIFLIAIALNFKLIRCFPRGFSSRQRE